MIAATFAMSLVASQVLVDCEPRRKKTMGPKNVMLHKMRSMKGRSLNDKYTVDWKTVLGEGAYGSVHPARVAATGEKVRTKIFVPTRPC